jgi:major vault protein
MALADHDGKQAGTVWQVVGECKFIPNKYTEVLKPINAIQISDGEGIYVKNVETSAKKLVKGPCAYLLEANEELFHKQYSEMERAALGLGAQATYEATVVRLQKGEVMCILDAEKNEHILVGPVNYILDPEEHVKVLYLSAGKPKKPKQIKVAKVRIGPDFMSDKFEVRTKDNAQLSLLLTYKWEFIVDKSEAYKVFALPDFIGYSCTTLCSRIREEAAKFTFEEFHSKTVGLIRSVLFQDHIVSNTKGEKSKVHGLYFDEIKLLISEVDVKEVTPVNDEINNLLNQSIKSNMIIVCNKMEQDANLKSQKEKIKTSAEIQKLRQNLIDIQNENMSLEKIENAKIEGQVQILKAKAQKEAEELKKHAKAKIELDRMKSIINLLNTEAGEKYLELLRAQNFAAIKQNWYVSSDNKVALPLQQ